MIINLYISPKDISMTDPETGSKCVEIQTSELINELEKNRVGMCFNCRNKYHACVTCVWYNLNDNYSEVDK